MDFAVDQGSVVKSAKNGLFRAAGYEKHDKSCITRRRARLPRYPQHENPATAKLRRRALSLSKVQVAFVSTFVSSLALSRVSNGHVWNALLKRSVHLPLNPSTETYPSNENVYRVTRSNPLINVRIDFETIGRGKFSF